METEQGWKRPYLWENILPSNTIHLLGGPSGAGKTRLLMGWLKEWQDKGTVMGMASPKCRIAYTAMDRVADSIRETLQDFGDLSNSLTWRSMIGRGFGDIKILLDDFPGVDLLIVDGIGTLVPDGKIIDYGVVARFLTRMNLLCAQAKMTILGILHTAKTKENEKYINPRQRIAGSVAWAAYAETIFLLDPLNPDQASSSNIRRLWVLPRNKKEFTTDYRFDQNGVLTAESSTEIETWDSREEAILAAIGGGSDRQDIVRNCFVYGISSAAVDRGLKKLLELGVIQRLSTGFYVQGCTPVGN